MVEFRAVLGWAACYAQVRAACVCTHQRAPMTSPLLLARAALRHSGELAVLSPGTENVGGLLPYQLHRRRQTLAASSRDGNRRKAPRISRGGRHLKRVSSESRKPNLLEELAGSSSIPVSTGTAPVPEIPKHVIPKPERRRCLRARKPENHILNPTAHCHLSTIIPMYLAAAVGADKFQHPMDTHSLAFLSA